ncbi:MAG: hypothetical protein KDB07_03565 [Planctomycetes bacterium]|nr:hypothetical protein [Planctomycetota bacterium]
MSNTEESAQPKPARLNAERKTMLIFSAAALLIVVTPILFFALQHKSAYERLMINEGDQNSEGPKVEQVSTKEAAARVDWNGVKVLHLVDRPFSNGRNGLERGAAIAEVWPAYESAREDFAHLQTRLPSEQIAWVEALFSKVLSDPSPTLRGAWQPDLVQETQGRQSEDLGELQRLLLATQTPDFVHLDALATSIDELGPVIAIEAMSPSGPSVGQWLTPIVLSVEPSAELAEQGQKEQHLFMLGIAGQSAPLLGMNLDGLAMVRLPIRPSKGYRDVQTGPDALTQLRVLLVGRSKAGVGEGEVGRDLIGLSETQVLTRLSTPSAMLCADLDSAWRYEWDVSDDPNRSGGLEFAKLEDDSRLWATTQFLAPEKRNANGEAYRSPLEHDLRRAGSIDDLIDWVQGASALHGDVPARVVLIPKLKRVLYVAGGKDFHKTKNPMLDLELGKAAGLTWRKRG